VWVAIAAWVGVLVSSYGVYAQRKDALELVKVEIGLELDRKFDSAEMRRARKELAKALIGRKPVEEWRVLDFFESVDGYKDKGWIDNDILFDSFSYYIENYWPAIQSEVTKFRKEQNYDGFYAGFEQLNNDVLQQDAENQHKTVAHIIPSDREIQDFLHDEANLRP